MRRSGLIAIFFISMLTFKVNALNVLTSIVPVHSLVSMLLDGISEAEVLLDGSVSAHGYSLRPSDLKKAQDADLIIYVSKNYEVFLHKIILNQKKQSIEILKMKGMNALLTKEPCCEHGHAHEDDHKDERHGIDPHFWLSPVEMKNALTSLYEVFKEVLPKSDHAKLTENFKSAYVDLEHLHKEVREILEPVKGAPFMVFHDGYRYIAKTYGLNYLGSVVSGVEAGLSLKDRKDIFNNKKHYNDLCIFYESQFSPKILDSLQEQISVKIGRLDPIGANMRGKGAYRTMMINLANNLRACLQK